MVAGYSKTLFDENVEGGELSPEPQEIKTQAEDARKKDLNIFIKTT